MSVKDKLYNDGLKMVIWTSPRADFVQRLSLPKLIKVLSHQRKFPNTVIEILGKVVNQGLLSKVKEGNYEIYSDLIPDFEMNPVLKRDRLFFVREQDANDYASRVGVKGLVRSVGNYNPPEGDLSGGDWQVFRLKSYLEGDETPLHILFERGILTDRKKNSYRVYFQARDSDHKRKYIAPFFYKGRDGPEINFAHLNDTIEFANSFPPTDLYLGNDIVAKKLEVQGD